MGSMAGRRRQAADFRGGARQEGRQGRQGRDGRGGGGCTHPCVDQHEAAGRHARLLHLEPGALSAQGGSR